MKKAVSTLSFLLLMSAVASAQNARPAGHTRAATAPSRRSDSDQTARLAKSNAGNAEAADKDDEVEQLLDRNVIALGGTAVFKIKSRIMRGSVEMSTSDVPGTFESYEKAPNKSLSVLNAPSGQFIQAYDGSKKWLQSPWGGMVATEQSGLEVVKQSLSKGSFRLKDLFSSASIKGRAVVDGHATVVLAATPVGRQPLLMYFDADTGLLRKQEFVNSGPPQEVELKAVYIDSYAQVDGVKIPVVFRQVYSVFTLTIRIYEVKDNVPIEDSLFENPKGN
ncbi:MAG TPA: hypothetical protein VLJ61_16350 [Pyrinomonadaceae bacterium]|nr:hypothetical protein [Pyrinomonadaceae bacterium]